MANERWVPTLSFELATIDGKVHVLRKGSLFVQKHIPDEYVMYRSIAVVTDYDQGVSIVNALRRSRLADSEEADDDG